MGHTAKPIYKKTEPHQFFEKLAKFFKRTVRLKSEHI
jgi:hypothetical protein